MTGQITIRTDIWILLTKAFCYLLGIIKESIGNRNFPINRSHRFKTTFHVVVVNRRQSGCYHSDCFFCCFTGHSNFYDFCTNWSIELRWPKLYFSFGGYNGSSWNQCILYHVFIVNTVHRRKPVN